MLLSHDALGFWHRDPLARSRPPGRTVHVRHRRLKPEAHRFFSNRALPESFPEGRLHFWELPQGDKDWWSPCNPLSSSIASTNRFAYLANGAAVFAPFCPTCSS